MSVKEKILYFWNVILGPDINEDDIHDPELDVAFSEVDAKAESLETKYFGTSNKSGKGGKASKVVETIAIDPKAVKKMAEKAAQKQEQEHDDLVR